MKLKNPAVVFISLIFINTTLLFNAEGHSQTAEQGKTVSLYLNNTPLELALAEIKKQTGISFIYNDELVSGKTITCSLDNSLPEAVLTIILKNSDISFKRFSKESIVLYEEKKPVPGNKSVVLIKKEIPEKETAGIKIKPILLTQSKPVYPPAAVRNKIEGNVKILFLINEKGNVANALVKSTSGSPLLDSSAVEYTKTLKYIPAQNDGEPQSVWITMIFKYFFEEED